MPLESYRGLKNTNKLGHLVPSELDIMKRNVVLYDDPILDVECIVHTKETVFHLCLQNVQG